MNDASEVVAVFIGDPSAEAEGVAQALRTAGFHVVDVPISMLVPRVAVQRPRVVILDADASEATGLVREIRTLPGGQMIQIVLLGGHPGGVEGNADHPLAEEAIAFFARPVDAPDVVRKVELLTGGPGENVRGPNARPSAPPSIAFGRRNLTPPPPASRSSRPNLASTQPSQVPPSLQASARVSLPSSATAAAESASAPGAAAARTGTTAGTAAGAATHAGTGTNAGTGTGTHAGTNPGAPSGTEAGAASAADANANANANAAAAADAEGASAANAPSAAPTAPSMPPGSQVDSHAGAPPSVKLGAPSVIPPSALPNVQMDATPFASTNGQKVPRASVMPSAGASPSHAPPAAPGPAGASLGRTSQFPRPSHVPRDLRSSIPSLGAPPTGFSQRTSRQAPLSREIEQLLADAEDRASGPRGSDSMFPSPEEELAAVLPADLLASLDQPLEEEEEDDVEPEREAPRGNTEQGRRSVTSSGGRRRLHDQHDSPSDVPEPEPVPPTNAPGRGAPTGAGDEPHATAFLHLDNHPHPGPVSLGSMPSMRSEVRSETRSEGRPEVQHTVPPSAPPGTGRESQRAPRTPSFGPEGGSLSYAPVTYEPSVGSMPFDHGARSLVGAPSSGSVPPTPMQFSAGPNAGFAQRPSFAPNTLQPSYPGGANVHMSKQAQAAPPATGQGKAYGQQAPNAAYPSPHAYPAQPSYPSHQAQQNVQHAQAAQHGGPGAGPAVVPSVLGPGDAARALAHVIAARASGALSIENAEGVRRVVLREGDVITAASGVDSETLLGFLAARGELPRDQVERLAGKVPPFGRHAGAALVAHGHLRQDQLWPVLRAHAEWILGRALLVSSGTAALENEPPGRLRGEPSVFGGATGGEVFVEAVRRVIAPDLAVQRLGGVGARLGFGASSQMLAECNLEPTLRERLERGAGETVGALIGAAPEADVASVLYALATLGVFETMRAISGPAGRPSSSSADAVGSGDLLDVDAVRARVRARLQLVEEGDYFELLGIARDATGYEIRRAFLELRRAFEPSRLLTPELADLKSDVDSIASVLDEAYEILRDNARRERYRRAITD